MTAPASTASPIADVSYRNYDGPLRRRLRWWIVALAGIRIAISRWYFWLFLALAMLPYLAGGFWIHIQAMQQVAYEQAIQQAAMADPMAAMAAMSQAPKIPPFALHFYQAAAFQGWWVLGLALSIGAASIAADSRANALLVYLSKPLTRVDYLFGKWMGIFLMLFAVSLAPALLLYLYCFISYAANGFFKNEPYLITQIIAAAAVPAAFHSSLLIGCSAFSRSGRIAGATYAGAYFLANVIIVILWGMLFQRLPDRGIMLRSFSFQGMIEGIQQNLFRVSLHIDGFSRRRGGLQSFEIPPPDWAIVSAVAATICIAALFLAWTRIRAVEVVRG